MKHNRCSDKRINQVNDRLTKLDSPEIKKKKKLFYQSNIKGRIQIEFKESDHHRHVHLFISKNEL